MLPTRLTTLGWWGEGGGAVVGGAFVFFSKKTFSSVQLFC